MSSRGEKPRVVVYPGASQSPLYNIHQGAYARDTGSAEVSDVAYTGGMFVKGADAAEVYSPSFPVNEWKYIIEGEWHMIQDGEKLIAKAGDVVFVPKRAAFTSLPVPFKAFFVTNRGAKDYTGIQAIQPPSPTAKL